MSMMFGLRAKNSSGLQLLHFDKTDKGVFLCLTGKLNGEDIQIDFDELDSDEVGELIYLLQRYK